MQQVFVILIKLLAFFGLIGLAIWQVGSVSAEIRWGAIGLHQALLFATELAALTTLLASPWIIWSSVQHTYSRRKASITAAAGTCVTLLLYTALFLSSMNTLQNAPLIGQATIHFFSDDCFWAYVYVVTPIAAVLAFILSFAKLPQQKSSLP
jgi:hypothetical protein